MSPFYLPLLQRLTVYLASIVFPARFDERRRADEIAMNAHIVPAPEGSFWFRHFPSGLSAWGLTQTMIKSLR